MDGQTGQALARPATSALPAAATHNPARTWPCTILSQVGQLESSKSGMYTLAPLRGREDQRGRRFAALAPGRSTELARDWTWHGQSKAMLPEPLTPAETSIESPRRDKTAARPTC